MPYKQCLAYSKDLIKETKIEVLKINSTTIYVYDKVTYAKKSNVTLPATAGRFALVTTGAVAMRRVAA